MIQNRLSWKPTSASSAKRRRIGSSTPPAPANTGTTGICSGLADEDDQQADDNRENAEAFGERGADDECRADLGCSVGVAPDGARRQAGEDAHTDAGSDDTKRGEAGSDHFH